MAELSALLNKRRLISEGAPGSPCKGRAASVPHASEARPAHGDPSVGKAEGWTKFRDMIRPLTNAPFPMFGGDSQPPLSPSCALAETCGPSQRWDCTGEFDECAELEPPRGEVQKTKACNFWSSSPSRRPRPEPLSGPGARFADVEDSPRKMCGMSPASPPSPLKNSVEFRELSANLAAEETTRRELARQLEAYKRSRMQDQKQLADKLLAEESKVAELLRDLEESKMERSRLAVRVQNLQQENSQVKEDNSKMKEESRILWNASAQVEAENQRLEEQNTQLLEKLAQLKVEAEKKLLEEENSRLLEELAQLKAEKSSSTICPSDAPLQRCESRETTDEPELTGGEGFAICDRTMSTESGLRSVMTKPGATADELRGAINAVEALVGEARRELAGTQLRERRAAFEALHAAIDKADEALLDAALVAARHAEVDAEDIEKGEAKLLQLRSMSDEERAVKASEELKAKLKPDLFLLVKRGAAEALEDKLAALSPSVRWEDWLDFNGRSLSGYAKELGATSVQQVLARRQRAGVQQTQAADSLPSSEAKARQEGLAIVRNLLESLEDSPGFSTPPFGSSPPPLSTPPPLSPGRTPRDHERIPTPDDMEPSPLVQETVVPSLQGVAEQEENKKAAFRAVVQDNVQILATILEAVPMSVWRSWENKAGRDLITLSMERGSSSAYALLARQLGLVVERKREVFEERETVWVFMANEVQPRRATVLEDTPECAEHVLVEFWDGDAAPEPVDRSCVVKSFS